jgi:hypothetical protein
MVGVRAVVMLMVVMLMVVMLTVAGCARRGEPAGFHSDGVRVEAVLAAEEVVVTFTPDPGYHVYSVDLPPDGIQGLGRPTVVRPVTGLVADGRLRADRDVVLERPAGLDVALPVYPAGPVTVRLPVSDSADGAGDPAVIEIGYAACSDRVCLAPVSGRRVTLSRP